MNRLMAGVLGLALLGAACSKSTTPTSPSTPSTPSTNGSVGTTYGGIVLLGTGEVGEITFTVSGATTAATGTASLTGMPRSILAAGTAQGPQAVTAATGTVTGTLTLPSGVVAVTGSLSATGALTLQGGGVSLTGTISNGTVLALGTGGGGISLSVNAAAGAASGAGPTNWIGTYLGSHDLPPGSSPSNEILQGRITMTIAATGSTSVGSPAQWVMSGQAQFIDPRNNNQVGTTGLRGTVTMTCSCETPSDIRFGGLMNGTAEGQATTFQGSIVAPAGSGWHGTFSGKGPDGGAQQGTFNIYPK